MREPGIRARRFVRWAGMFLVAAIALGNASPVSSDEPMRIALRVPNREVYDALRPYQDGTLARIPFVMYAGIDAMELLDALGATRGENPVQLAVLIGCSHSTPDKVRRELSRYAAIGVTQLLMDCEKGDDDLWRFPDVPPIVEQIQSVIDLLPKTRPVVG